MHRALPGSGIFELHLRGSGSDPMEPLMGDDRVRQVHVPHQPNVPDARKTWTLNMKKHTLPVIAAALLATPAFAQMKAPKLTWNFNGVFDVGFRSIYPVIPRRIATFVSNSNTYTTLLIGRLRADFENGYAGIALVEIDHDPTHSNKANQAVGWQRVHGIALPGPAVCGPGHAIRHLQDRHAEFARSRRQAAAMQTRSAPVWAAAITPERHGPGSVPIRPTASAASLAAAPGSSVTSAP